MLVVSCAGTARTGRFMEVPLEDMKRQMDVNYFGALHTARAAVPLLASQREPTHLLIVSSAMALTAYAGYSAYAGTKFALRGLAEVLRHELLPLGIKVHSAYPPNMDTPGFEVENRTKPAETKAIESFETTYKPQEVASAILDAVGNGEFHASCGDFGINMLVRGSSGMSPRANTMMDLLLLPLIGIVGFVYRYFWDREVQKYRREQRAAVSDAAAAATATEAGTGGAATTDPLLKPGQETTLYGVAADGAGAGHGKP